MRFRRKRCILSRTKHWNGNTSDLEALGRGVSGRVLAIDRSRVIKVALGSPRSLKDIETEREAYRRIATKPSCPYIAKCYDYENARGIIIERLDQTVRHRLRQSDSIPAGDDVLKWTLQAASGLAFLHSNDIVQADVGCHNMLLDSVENLKLCDFSGCSIDGRDASVCYEPWSQLPSVDMPNKRSDIFALGSAMYEMAVGHVPFLNLSEYEIVERYETHRFPTEYPDTRDERLGKIIEGCWTGDYKTADEVVTQIKLINQHIDCPRKSKRRFDGTGTSSYAIPWLCNINRYPKTSCSKKAIKRLENARLQKTKTNKFWKGNFCI